MLRQVLSFLMVWQWGGEQQQSMSMIDACISSVEVYFPCTLTPDNAEAQCLCEQYLWRAKCFSNHGVKSTPTFGHRNTTEQEMDSYCEAAGSIGAAVVKRNYELNRRQVDSIISSIASTIRANGTTPTSTTPVLISSAAVGISSLASARVSSAVPSFFMSAVVTSQAPAVATSAAAPPDVLSSAAVVPTAATATSSPTSTTSDTSDSQATSSPSPSGPSAGLIAGAVIGSIAVLVLAGILVMLILRHKKKSSNNPQDANGAEQGHVEKEVYNGETHSGMHRGNEMSTMANAWELEGHVPPSAWELEAANTHHPNVTKQTYLPKN